MTEVLTYENTKLHIIRKDHNIWFRAKTIANILNYKNTRKAIRDHVDDEDKSELNDLKPRGARKNNHMIYINESGLYSLINRSNMGKAKDFKRWVMTAIRKTDQCDYNHKLFKMLAFNMQTEYDLHKKVVNYIRNHHPKALLTPSLGENQISIGIRLRSYFMGYQKGSPDIIIQNLHKTYSGFAIELKTPKGTGQLSENQKVMLREYVKNGFKVLVSNDYDEILTEIIRYFDGVITVIKNT